MQTSGTVTRFGWRTVPKN